MRQATRMDISTADATWRFTSALFIFRNFKEKPMLASTVLCGYSPIYGKIRVKRVSDLICVVILTATFTHASNSS